MALALITLQQDAHTAGQWHSLIGCHAPAGGAALLASAGLVWFGPAWIAWSGVVLSSGFFMMRRNAAPDPSNHYITWCVRVPVQTLSCPPWCRPVCGTLN